MGGGFSTSCCHKTHFIHVKVIFFLSCSNWPPYKGNLCYTEIQIGLVVPNSSGPVGLEFSGISIYCCGFQSHSGHFSSLFHISNCVDSMVGQMMQLTALDLACRTHHGSGYLPARWVVTVFIAVALGAAAFSAAAASHVATFLDLWESPWGRWWGSVGWILVTPR